MIKIPLTPNIVKIIQLAALDPVLKEIGSEYLFTETEVFIPENRFIHPETLNCLINSGKAIRV